MNVRELKDYIENLPDEMEVILQKDSEGNGYSPLSDADADANYVPTSTWSGEVYFDEWSAEDCCLGITEWKEMRSKPKSLILTPVN